MSFIYPRTVNIVRTVSNAPAGLASYSDLESEQTIATGLPASIQLKKESNRPAADVPGDALKRSIWSIMIPSQPNGLIQSRDIAVDDLGIRYQVIAPYWNSLGYNLLSERLEA